MSTHITVPIATATGVSEVAFNRDKLLELGDSLNWCNVSEDRELVIARLSSAHAKTSSVARRGDHRRALNKMYEMPRATGEVSDVSIFKDMDSTEAHRFLLSATECVRATGCAIKDTPSSLRDYSSLPSQALHVLGFQTLDETREALINRLHRGIHHKLGTDAIGVHVNGLREFDSEYTFMMNTGCVESPPPSSSEIFPDPSSLVRFSGDKLAFALIIMFHARTSYWELKDELASAPPSGKTTTSLHEAAVVGASAVASAGASDAALLLPKAVAVLAALRKDGFSSIQASMTLSESDELSKADLGHVKTVYESTPGVIDTCANSLMTTVEPDERRMILSALLKATSVAGLHREAMDSVIVRHASLSAAFGLLSEETVKAAVGVEEESTTHTTTHTEEEAPMATPTTPTESLRPEIVTAVNALLEAGGAPKIEVILGTAKTAAEKAKEMETELEKAKAKMLKMASAPAVSAVPAVVEATGELPKGDVVWITCLEALTRSGIEVPKGVESMFEFQVPYFEWEHEHRDVPALDEDYKYRWDVLAKLMWGIVANKNPWVWGHTGTGKTTLVEQICAVLKWPFVRVNFDSEITRMDLVGRDSLKTDEHGNTVSVFTDGILPQAMSTPTVICCDELDFIRSDIAYVFQRSLEAKGLLLTEDAGRLVTPHPMCRIVATANTQGQGDEFGLYQGARVQSSAFLDRFQCWVEVKYLDSNDEHQLVEARVPTLESSMVEKIIQYVNEHRVAFTQAEILKPISPRGVVSLGEALAFFTGHVKSDKEAVRMALETTVLGSVTHADAAKINELIDRTFN